MQATVKPCLKCPEGTAAGMPIALNMQAPGRGHDQRINYVLNEGDVRVFHYTLGQAIPDVEMKYGRPVVHEDGSFEFPVLEGVGDAVGEPEELYGYEQDGENRRLFRPMWPDCSNAPWACSFMRALWRSPADAITTWQSTSPDQSPWTSAGSALPVAPTQTRANAENGERIHRPCRGQGERGFEEEARRRYFRAGRSNLKAWALWQDREACGACGDRLQIELRIRHRVVVRLRREQLEHLGLGKVHQLGTHDMHAVLPEFLADFLGHGVGNRLVRRAVAESRPGCAWRRRERQQTG